MAKTRNWEALSDSYRTRLSRGGITRADYESGASVSAARGHATTPERPERVSRNPGRYVEYVTRQVKGEDARKLARETKAIGKRYGLDDILEIIPPEQRAEYVAGWQVAHAQYLRNGKGSHLNDYARMRLDTLESDHPDIPKELGFYH